MKQVRKLIPFIVASYILVLGVNILGNFSYYAAGNDWHYSVFFTLGMTTLCWIWFSLLYYLVFRRLQWHDKPIMRVLVASLIYGLAGAGITAIAMKSMVLFMHFPEQSLYDYINSSIYAGLFSMVIGLMITAWQVLVHLKKSIEDNERMKREMILSQYEVLKSQVNPHFLFNSLNTLLVMIPRQPDVAATFVEKMSRVFRYSLQHSDDNTVVVATELAVVEAYLFLNTQRYGDKLQWGIAIPEHYLQKTIITQSLLMLVENAIKHNELSHERPLHIAISVSEDFIVVSNTLQRKELIEASTRVGLANIKKRYELVTPTPVVIDEASDLFTVKIPLLP